MHYLRSFARSSLSYDKGEERISPSVDGATGKDVQSRTAVTLTSELAEKSDKQPSKVSLIKFLIIHQVKLIALRRYKDCYLVLEDDVAKLESVLATPLAVKEFTSAKKVGLDARLFHWKKDKHRDKEILLRIEITYVTSRSVEKYRVILKKDSFVIF